MIVKNKLLKFSSLCIIGSITIIVNQMMPSNAGGNKYTDLSKQSGASAISSTYSSSADADSISPDGTNLAAGNTISSVNASGAEVAANADDASTPTVTPEPTKDPKAIPGIDYKEYINMDNYKNIAIADLSSGYLNVRKGPGINNTIIAKMPPKSGCTVLETTKNDAGEAWCKIQSGSVTGYVMQKYIITGEEAQKLVPEVGYLAIKVDVDVLNVREKASTDSELLYQVAKGEELKVVSVTKDWIAVNTDLGEDTAYVSREFVTITFTLDKAIDVDELLSGCSTERANIVAYAKQFLGNPYVYGGTNLYKGIDCSAFTRAMYKKFGYTLHRSSRDQAASDGTKITEAQLQPGDLVFYANSSGTVKHVAMFIGNGKIIHASNPRDGIKISNMKYTTPYRYKRIFND